MLLAHYDRYQYAASPLIETICQLRFPVILSVGTREPVEFQEAVRHDYPRYTVTQENPTPRPVGAAGGAEQSAPILNHTFISADGAWKINLTNHFVALSSLRYTRWEDFAQRLDRVLAAFIQTYQPSFFERIGLRYINALSRKRMSLEDTPWSELIAPGYLGVLAEPDVEEHSVSKCALDAELALDDDCRLKLHAGPGLLGGGKQDPEVKFILDNDCSSSGSFSPAQTPERLEQLHRLAVRAFRGAITSGLHTAMGASPLD